MKKIVRDVISVLFLTGVVTGYASMAAGAPASGPSASGTYRFARDYGLSKSVEFTATTDERGVTTGQMTFRDEARIVEQDVDGVGGRQEASSEFYMMAIFDSLTIDHNRAVMGGTIADSNIQ